MDPYVADLRQKKKKRNMTQSTQNGDHPMYRVARHWPPFLLRFRVYSICTTRSSQMPYLTVNAVVAHAPVSWLAQDGQCSQVYEATSSCIPST